jgi:hypothetical protein
VRYFVWIYEYIGKKDIGKKDIGKYFLSKLILASIGYNA